MKFLAVISIFLFTITTDAAYMGKEKWSVGLFGGITTSTQSDMNLLINRANTREGGISTPQFGNHWEFGGYIQRRLNRSLMALHLRPSYFFASVDGTGGSGAHNYSVSGFAIMPMIRTFLLESKSVQLYMQIGIGWGQLSGKIQEGSAVSNFTGSNFGFQGGMGVLFCLSRSRAHCLFAEGNVRYLSIERNIASGSSGTFASDSLTRTGVAQEVEVDNHDFGTTMSGVQGLFGYHHNF